MNTINQVFLVGYLHRRIRSFRTKQNKVGVTFQLKTISTYRSGGEGHSRYDLHRAVAVGGFAKAVENLELGQLVRIEGELRSGARVEIFTTKVVPFEVVRPEQAAGAEQAAA